MDNYKIIENGLIPIMENEYGDQLVDGRKLHEFLEIKDNYTTWIKDRIDKYDFIKDVDFTSFLEKPKKPTGGRPSEEYVLTLDTAKEIAMVQNNKKGKEARRYFINIEKKYKNQGSSYKCISPIVKDELEIAELMAEHTGVKKGIAIVTALSRSENRTGESLEEYKALLPPAEHETGYITVKMISSKLNISSIKVNKKLAELELQIKETYTRKSTKTGEDKKESQWRITDKGKQYGEEFPYNNHGHSGYQIRWNESVINLLEGEQCV